MPSHPDGLAIARARIADEKERQTGFLDLGRLGLTGAADFQRYKLMQDFAHRVGDVLARIADTLLPADFEELVRYGFGDETTS